MKCPFVPNAFMLSFTLTGVKFPGNQDAEHSKETLQIMTFRDKKKKK